ncbi:MAG: protease inhibitor I42 family protein [Hyphomonadaceae bacterium]
MERLQPPAIEGATIRVTAADAGKTIAAPVGATFSVALVGVPTAGYLWTATETPDFLVKVGESGGPTSAAQLQPGFAGGNHWEVTAFRAVKAGRGVLRFAQGRPWETNQPPVDTFSVTIEAR